MRFCFFCLLVILPLKIFAVEDYDREQIKERISPVGKVNEENSRQEEVNTKPVSTAAVIEKRSGQAIYEHYCIICHKDGLAGSPKFRDSADWSLRMTKKNIDSLTESALNGLNAMPAKGTCQDCLSADLKAAIEYIVPQK